MRDPPVAETFPSSIRPFRSLLHMETDSDRRSAFGPCPVVWRRAMAGCLRCLYPVRGGHRRHARPLHRARAGIWERADWDESTRTLILRAPQPGGRIGDVARLALGSRVATAPSRGGLRGRGAVRLVRPLAVARREDSCGSSGRPAVERCAARPRSAGTVAFAVGIVGVIHRSARLVGLNAECNGAAGECPRSDRLTAWTLLSRRRPPSSPSSPPARSVRSPPDRCVRCWSDAERDRVRRRRRLDAPVELLRPGPLMQCGGGGGGARRRA